MNQITNIEETDSREQWREKIQDTDMLCYGDIEPHLDKYLPKFFSVEVREVGFNDEHPMNTLEFWYTVSWLNRMDFLDYGTSPRGAWLTDEGEQFKKYILSTPQPITKIIYDTQH